MSEYEKKPNVFMEGKIDEIGDPSTTANGSRYVRARFNDGYYWHTIMAFDELVGKLERLKDGDRIRIEAVLQYYNSNNGKKTVLLLTKVELANGKDIDSLPIVVGEDEDGIPF